MSLGKDISPAPGPIKNMTLLVTNYDARCFEARPELVMAKHGNQGDYRKISKEMWDHFCDFYPGSGPEIKMYFKEVQFALAYSKIRFDLFSAQDADHFNDCKYDTSGWIINQSSYTEYILENPHPKKKAYDNEDLPQMLSGGAVTAASASAGNTEGEMPQQLSAGRMEDNRVTDEQRHNLSIFLGGGKIEDTVRTSTVADGYANVVRKPDRSAKKLTVCNFVCMKTIRSALILSFCLVGYVAFWFSTTVKFRLFL